MDIKHHDPTALPKQKRIKVSRACYTCRVKKIKCDGMNPCMQRPCSFSKEGLPLGSPSPNGSPTMPPLGMATRQGHESGTPTSQHDVNGGGNSSSSTSTSTSSNKSKSRSTMDTLQRLDTLAQTWPGYDMEQRAQGTSIPLHSFLFAIDKVDAHYGERVPMAHVHQGLLQAYFRHRHPLFPLIPKNTLLEWLRNPSPAAYVSPLLLNAIYAHGALTMPSSAHDADTYFQQARALVHQSLDSPRIHTVIAFCLLALYESNRMRNMAARMHAAAASRMCLDLIPIGHQQPWQNTNPLLLRVYWCCFCMDRWLNVAKDAAHPAISALPDIKMLEDEGLAADQEQLLILDGMRAMISLLQLADHLNGQQQDQPATPDRAMHDDHALTTFLKSLPAALQWTPVPASHLSVLYQALPSQPPHHPIIASLHLLLNFISLRHLLKPLQMDENQHHPPPPPPAWLLQRCAIVATNITQLGCALDDQPNHIFLYATLADALMLATRVHLMHCYPLPANQQQQQQQQQQDAPRLAKHARLMFQRSLRSLRRLIEQRDLPDIVQFTATLEKWMSNLTMSLYASPPPLSIKPHHHNHHQIHHSAQHTQHHSHQHPPPPLHHALNHPMHQQPRTPPSQQHPLSLPPPPSLLAAPAPPPPPPSAHPSTQYLEQSAAEILTANDKPAPLIKAKTQGNAPKLVPQHPQQQPPPPAIVTHHATPPPPPPPPPPPAVVIPGKAASASPSFANVTTAGTNNPLYHQDPPQLHSHFSYALPFGRQDEIWALQEQLQQQEQQQHHHHANPPSQDVVAASSPASFSLFTSSLLGYNLSPPPNTTDGATIDKKTPELPASPSQTPATTAAGRSFGLGVYASAQRHHSDVISQHLPGNKNTHPVLLNHHGQVVVTPSEPVVDLPSL
ncbi:fungal-specific transcription factor domain-containing protein [Gongronella butleri]|nr:fungal-specific transcription factor domain-containing protein [Gongronella butleri]